MKSFIALLYLGVLISISACGQSRGAAETVLAPAAYAAALAETPQAQLIDVRTASEYAAGHLPSAQRVDIRNRDFVAQLEASLDKTQPVYLYCLSGIRSASAARMLRQAGFEAVYDLQGGIRSWSAAKLPVVTP